MKSSLVAFTTLLIVLAIGLAQARLAVPYNPLIAPPHASQAQLVELATDKCDLCVAVLTAVAKLASLNNTQAAIVAYVEAICAYLPQEMQTECEEMVEIGTPVLITFLIDEMGPKLLCQDINLCNTTASPSPTPSPPKPTPPSDRCVICEFVVSTLQGLLANEQEEKLFLQECAAACVYLPVPEQQPCRTLIQDYGESAMMVVLKYATPSFVCQEARLC
jgi:saposin